MEHVKVIAQAPHPSGSAEIKRVRGYILAELESMGLAPEVQETSIAVTKRITVTASAIKNLVARKRLETVESTRISGT